MNNITTIWNGLDWSVVTNILLSVVPALLVITFHELSHGLVALMLGDTTAKDAGRLTLNPIRHIDPMGLLMLVIFRFGWAKPVPVDMRRFKNPKQGMALTALAGPVSNFLLACLMLFLYGILYKALWNAGSAGVYALQMIYLSAYISLALGIFNLIPVPPLDGSKVLFAFIPDSAYMKLMRYERYGMLILLALIAIGVLGTPLVTATSAVFEWLSGITQWAYGLVVPGG
jgi:Zn-dependent protease